MLRSISLGLACLALSQSVSVQPATAQGTMSVATNPQGSAYYAVGSAVAKVATEADAARLLVQPTSGSSENVALLQVGDVEFAILNTVELAWAWAGDESVGGRKHDALRLVSAMFQFPIGIAVPADSDIRSIEDLAGKRMPTGYASHRTIRHIQDAILATGGLSMADVEELPVANYVQGMQALGDGRVDAAVVGPTSGKAREIDSQLAGRGGIRMLAVPATEEALAAMNEHFPGSQHHELSADRGLPGIGSDINIMAWSGFLAANADVPGKTVMAVTEALAQHVQDLQSATPTLKHFSAEVMVEPHPVPYHNGAIAYYKDAGLWKAGSD